MILLREVNFVGCVSSSLCLRASDSSNRSIVEHEKSRYGGADVTQWIALPFIVAVGPIQTCRGRFLLGDLVYRSFSSPFALFRIMNDDA